MAFPGGDDARVGTHLAGLPEVSVIFLFLSLPVGGRDDLIAGYQDHFFHVLNNVAASPFL